MIAFNYVYIFTIVCISSSSGFSRDWIECYPDNIVIENEDTEEKTEYKTYLNITYDRNDLAVYKSPDVIEEVNIMLPNAIISLSTFKNLESENSILDDNSIVGDLNTTITGTARIKRVYHVGDALTECDLYLTKHFYEIDGLSRELQLRIMNEATSCLRGKLCKKLDIIRQDDLDNASKYPFNFGPISIAEGNDISGTEGCNASSYDLTTIVNSGESVTQETINALMDLMLSRMSEKMKENGEGKVKIANVTNLFSFFGYAYFNAVDGTFEDISILERKSDVSLTHDDMKFIFTCTFGLSEGYINYEYYKLQHSFFGSYEGAMNGTVYDLYLTVEIAINFDKSPCEVELNDLRVAELGNIQIALTGLGGLGSLLSGIISFSTAFFKNEIARTIEIKMRKFIIERLEQYSCATLQ